MIILNLIQKAIEITWLIARPIILFGILYIAVKLVYYYKKYGYLELDIFEKRPITKFSDLILVMLDKIKGYKKIYKAANLYADVIIIDRTGIYLLKLIKYQGLIIGERDELELTNQLNVSETINIDNPFYFLDQDRKKLKEFNQDLIVKVGLVTSNIVNITVNKVTKEEVFMIKDFYFKMEKHLKQNRVYTKRQIKDIYKKIKSYNFD